MAIHAVVITTVWVFSQTMPHTPSLEPALVIAVTLADPQDSDSPTRSAHQPAPPLMRIAPRPLPSQPTPDPAPNTEPVQPEFLPEANPDPDPSPLLAEETAPTTPAAQAEPTPDAVAGDEPGDASAVQTTAHAQYRPLVLAILERAKRYPLLAQRRGWEGTVEIAFLIGPDGRISGAQVVVPSPHRVLDEATLDMLNRIESLPAPPDRSPLRFPVRIEYTLDSIASPVSAEGANP